MRGVNLIPAKRRAAQQRKRRFRAWIGATVGYTGLAFAVCAATRTMWDHSNHTAAAELQQYGEHITQLNSRLSDLRKQLVEAEVSRKTADTIRDQSDWSILLSMLGASVGDEIVLREIQLKPESMNAQSKAPQQAKSFNLQLRGFARSQPAVSQFVLRLQQAGIFDEVKLARTGREPVNNSPAITFDISCAMRESHGRTP